MLRVPLLWPSSQTPAVETEAIKRLYAHLSGLAYSIHAWEAALLLYQTALNPPSSISREVASRWRFVAANECIWELYHLRARLEKVQSVVLRDCPSIVPLVDRALLRRSRKQLDEYFPDIEALRHATAHKGEIEAHPEAHASNGLYAPVGFREPNRFSAPYEGQLRYLDITNESLEKVVNVVAAYVGAFAPATTALEEQGHLE